MNKKPLITIAIILLGGLVLWFLYAGKHAATEPSLGNGSIKIGGIFALTGLGADQGEQEQKGAELAVSQINKRGGINGRPLQLVSGDVSLDKLSVAVSVARNLISSQGVTAIVGTTWDEPAEAIVPVAGASQVPMIGQNQTRMVKAKNTFPYFFSTWYDNEIGIREMLGFAESKGWTHIAIVRPVAAGFYQYVSDKINANAKEFGITIVDDVNLNNPAASDFRTPLTKLKVQKPDAIFVVLGGFTECPFLKQAAELGVNVPILSTEAAVDYGSLRKCPQLMSNLYASYPKETAKFADFSKEYYAMFGINPETPSIMTTYDAVNILARALKETNGQGGPALQKVLASTTDYRGVSLDSITFDSMGYAITPSDVWTVMTVKDGKFVTAK